MKKSSGQKPISNKNITTATKISNKIINLNSNLNTNNNSPLPNKNTNFTFKSSSSKNNPIYNTNSLHNQFNSEKNTKTENEMILASTQPEYTQSNTKSNNLRAKQSINLIHNMGRINSTNSANSTKSAQPFKKLEHDFFVEKTENLWGKELQKIKTEKRIFENSNKKCIEENRMNFGGNNVVNNLK